MIKNERLELYPLTPHQLKLWIEDIPALEKELYKKSKRDGSFAFLYPYGMIWHNLEEKPKTLEPKILMSLAFI